MDVCFGNYEYPRYKWVMNIKPRLSLAVLSKAYELDEMSTLSPTTHLGMKTLLLLQQRAVVPLSAAAIFARGVQRSFFIDNYLVR